MLCFRSAGQHAWQGHKCDALTCLAAGIVHRDLKLENMVMLNDRDDSPVKIADFGLSKFFSPDNVLSTMCGSPQVRLPCIFAIAMHSPMVHPMCALPGIMTLAACMAHPYQLHLQCSCCAVRGPRGFGCRGWPQRVQPCCGHVECGSHSVHPAVRLLAIWCVIATLLTLLTMHVLCDGLHISLPMQHISPWQPAG